jgi:KDO2-lipid IV(A) lauroyltransferase
MRHFKTKILSYFLFGVLILLSLLPFWVLYGIADLLAFILCYVLRYRKKVVMKNLEGSIQGDSNAKKIIWPFYRFLADVFVESIKCFTISKKNLLKRIICVNPEIMEQYAQKNKSVIFMSAHYCNWEYLIYSMNLLFPHWAIGVGKPLSNAVMNKLTNARRSRFGMKIINAKNIKEEFQKDKDKLTANLFLSDQYPGGKSKGYHCVFLNKETDFLYGAEKYAAEYDYSVVYGDFRRLKRGRYQIEIIKITDKPKETEFGYIMSIYVGLLQKSILSQPEFWLWSHKRWKHLPNFYG